MIIKIALAIVVPFFGTAFLVDVKEADFLRQFKRPLKRDV